MSEFVDYISDVSSNIKGILHLVNDKLTDIEIKNVVTSALGEVYSVNENKVMFLSDWKVMLTDDFVSRVSNILIERHQTDISGGRFYCVRAVIINTVMCKVPISFKISDLLRHDFKLDNSSTWKNRRKKTKNIIDTIMIPMIEARFSDEVNSLGEMYDVINFNMVKNTLFDMQSSEMNQLYKAISLFNKEFNEEACSSESGELKWSYLLHPFYDVSLLFSWLLEKK